MFSKPPQAEYKASGINPFSHGSSAERGDVRRAADGAAEDCPGKRSKKIYILSPLLPPPELPGKFFGYGTVRTNAATRILVVSR